MGIEFELIHKTLGASKAGAHAPFRPVLTTQDECRVGNARALISRDNFDAATFSFDASYAYFARACVLENVASKFRYGGGDFRLYDFGKT